MWRLLWKVRDADDADGDEEDDDDDVETLAVGDKLISIRTRRVVNNSAQFKRSRSKECSN